MTSRATTRQSRTHARSRTAATEATSTPQATGGVQAPNAWRLLALLTFANILNFFDRTIPAVVVEPLKAEFGLNDAQVGMISAVFTVVYAVAGIALGRISDRGSRRRVMGWGLIAWSVLTAASGGAWSFVSLLLIRAGVGIGEAAYAPAANSVISDLFPPLRRSRAVAVFQLGVPLGLVLAFFTVGAMAQAFGSWRAPFYVAAVPGVLLGIALLFVDEPRRGASEPEEARSAVPAVAGSEAGLSFGTAVRRILRVRTMWWLILSGIGAQVASYSASTFLVPLLMRFYHLSLPQAGLGAGFVLGVTGVFGLLAAGWVTDRASRKSVRGRVLVGAVSLGLAAPLSFWALSQGPGRVSTFVAVFSVAWLLQYAYHTSTLPAVADVIEPRLRSTAIAIFFAAFYLLGAAFGPVLAGVLSDHYAASSGLSGADAVAHGLRSSLRVIVPLNLLVSAVGLVGAATTIVADRDRARADA